LKIRRDNDLQNTTQKTVSKCNLNPIKNRG
jgi:hypothetical protein